MTTRLSEMTPEHLGPNATAYDLHRFKQWVWILEDEYALTEEEAVARLWGDGDYLKAARRYELPGSEHGST